MPKEHIGIVIPGLGNTNPLLEMCVKRMQKSGLEAIIFDARWKMHETDFSLKLEKLIALINNLKRDNHTTSIIGISAGGSLGLLAFNEMLENITSGITICARLRNGDNTLPWQENVVETHPAHKETVAQFEKVEPQMNSLKRMKIMTITPLWDEVVPVSTMPLNEAANRKIMMVGHGPSMYTALTLYSRDIAEFVSNNC